MTCSFTSFRAAGLATFLGLLSAVQPASAEIIFALTTQNALISFDSATPGTVSTVGAITGVTAGDILAGIDFRPSLGPNNGRLYAVGVNTSTGTARIYTLNTATGAATLVSTLAADPADNTAPFPFTTVAGTTFGVDFNPVPDRLRITSNTGQNLRINVDNGLVQLDVPLTYESGDINFGDAPVVTAVAYSNNFGGAASTTLRGVDVGQSSDALVVHTNPNSGLLSTALALPFDSLATIGYDISGLTGTPYFSVTTTASPFSSLYAGTTLVGLIGGGVSILDIAAPVGAPIPEPATYLLTIAGLGGLAVRRRRMARSC